MNGPCRFDFRKLRGFTGGFAWPTILLCLGTWALFLSVATLFFYDHVSRTVMVLVASICNFYSFTVLHEAVHENIEGKSRGGMLTTLLGAASGAMFMAPFQAFKVIHLTHHQHTNAGAKDPDFWVASRYFFLTLLKCLTIYPHYVFTYMTKLSESRRQLAGELLTIVAYWTVALFALSTPYGDIALYAFIIPTFLGTGITALLFDWLPHHPHQETSQALNTRNFPGFFLHVLLAGQNVHQLHHVNPRIPFFRYHKAFKAAVLP